MDNNFHLTESAVAAAVGLSPGRVFQFRRRGRVRVIDGTVVKAIRAENVSMIEWDGCKFFISKTEGIAEMLTGSDERGDYIGKNDLFVTTYHGESGVVTIFSVNGGDCQITLKSTAVELPALESHPRRVIVDLFARPEEE